MGACLPVPSALNIPLWWSRLQDYPDFEVCDFLEFGWPVGLDYSSPLLSDKVTHNHKGATDSPLAMESYLSEELGCGAVIGPLASNPFSCSTLILPLNSVPKLNSFKWQMILDLVGLLVCQSMIYPGQDLLITSLMVATGQEIVREKKILQGQGKVREFHFESGKIYIFEKSQGKVKF